jgi:SAM-dependent methyltransferase
MLELAAAEATKSGVSNARFQPGDATALDLPDASFGGAVTRFSFHHIPLPGRCLTEMARVVRPGGLVVVGDGVASEDGAANAWHQEIERLRDPSHWANLTIPRIRELAGRGGLELVREQVVALRLDFADWLERGSGGAANRATVEAAFAERPEGSDAFRLETDREGRRWLRTRYYLAVWWRV